MFLILAALKVGQSNGWYPGVLPELYLKASVEILKEISVGGDLDENDRKSTSNGPQGSQQLPHVSVN